MEATVTIIAALLIGAAAVVIFTIAASRVVGAITRPRRARLEQERVDKAYRARNARMSRRK